ncbi:MAG: SRPBCC family protein [Saprospiraceae bacterium]|nr:SRPBCC family protein [Saprospiraceae bacterium]
MDTTKITIQAVISADRQKVWDYYTKPEHITRWNFADPSWHCPTASNDIRVGGKYLARMEAKDGSFGFDFEAIYNEVKDGEKFTFTMTDNRIVEATFKEREDKTELTIIFDAESENPVDMQQQGWQSILDNFKKYVENN